MNTVRVTLGRPKQFEASFWIFLQLLSNKNIRGLLVYQLAIIILLHDYLNALNIYLFHSQYAVSQNANEMFK